MSQTSDSSTRALATRIGATPATLHAQAPAKVPTREAVQEKHGPEAVQNKVSAKEAVQNKAVIQKKEAVQQKGGTATPAKEAVQNKAPVTAPAKPF